MQFEVIFTAVVDVDEEVPENIYTAAFVLMEQGIGEFEYYQLEN